MNTLLIATEIITFEEGFRSKPYYCSEGYPTIGIGTKIGNKSIDIKDLRLEFSGKVAKVILEEKILEIDSKLASHNFYDQNCERQAVLISMAYQLGVSGLLKFKKTLRFLDEAKYESAAKECLDSRWARQTPNRARRHAEVIRKGVLSPCYKLLFEKA